MKEQAYILMREMEDAFWWYRARREILCDVIARHVPAGAEILDYGSGTGATARALRSAGYSVTAGDVSDHSLSACRDAGLTTIDLRSQELAPCSTDAILAGDVLEHVQDDVALLGELRDALRSDGWLILTVPAYSFLWSGEDYVSEHVRRYTRRGLLRTLRFGGFETIWCSYFNTLLFPGIATTLLARRLLHRRGQRQSNVSKLPDQLNDLLFRIFRLEKRALRRVRFPFGLSILVIARPAKPDRLANGVGLSIHTSDVNAG